jgi:hypothetical protein
MKIDHYRVMLYVDGVHYGDLTSIEQGHDEEEYEGWIGEPIIFKTWKSNSTWEFKMPGMELAVRKFLHVTLEDKKTYKVLVDSEDIYVVMLYPYENSELYKVAYEMVINAKIPHTVYNEDTVMIGGDHGEEKILSASPTMYTETAEQDRLLELLPGLKDEVTCPVCKDTEDEFEEMLWDIIQHLNDIHKWTRESIADWLDTLDADITFPIGEDANGN